MTELVPVPREQNSSPAAASVAEPRLVAAELRLLVGTAVALGAATVLNAKDAATAWNAKHQCP